MDVPLDEIIAKSAASSWRTKNRDTPRSGRGGGNDGKPRMAGAAELQEMDNFFANRSKNTASQGGASAKGKGRSARWQPYGGYDNRAYDGYHDGGYGWQGRTKGGGGGGKDRWDSQGSRWGKGTTAGGDGRTVLLRNLDHTIMAEDLRELFRDFDLLKAWIDYDSTDRSDGSGGVIFQTARDAEQAYEQYNGAVVDGHKVCMELQGSHSKGKGKRW